MATNRTYGVEIECACKLTRAELSLKIQEAFVIAGIDHICTSTYYQHNTDGTNKTRWEVQSDGSIRTTGSHQNQIEVVSPVLSGIEGLASLKIVCDVVNEYGKINSSCGLHVHHGVNSWGEVEKIAAVFSEYQDVIYKGLPPSRSTGRYSRKWYAGSLSNQIRRARQDRYTGLNLCSYALRKTIEFRCAGGSTEYEKISNWVLFTQGLVEAAINNNTQPVGSDIDGLVEFVTAGVDYYQSIRGCQASKRSKIALQLNRLVAAGCWTRPELIEHLVSGTGCKLASAQTIVSDCLNDKYNPLKRKVVVIDGIYKFTDDSRTADADYQQAAAWFKSRYNHFQNAA